MHQFNPQPDIPPSVLATDLDGTFIPLDSDQQNRMDLERIKQARMTNGFQLVFATGRHFSSVIDAMGEFDLPQPDWLVCDVGSSVYRFDDKSGAFVPFEPYVFHLEGIVGGSCREKIEGLLGNLEGLQLQSAERQQTFKISYECAAGRLPCNLRTIKSRLEDAALPYACTGSIDPFEHCGLIDILPTGVSKAYALIWLSSHADFQPDEVVFSGDSGNDLAALVAGFRAIVVGNDSPGLAEEAQAQLQARGLPDRLYRAQGTATSGVLEGCRHYGLI